LEEAKKADPKFKSDKDKKAFDFLKNYNVDKFGNGLGNYARLIGIDPDTINEKIALQETFVLKNPDLEREEALLLFNDEYDEKYTVEQNELEEDKAFANRQKLSDIKKKQDAASSRKYLKEQQEAFKPEEGDGDAGEPSKTEKPKVSPEAISKYSKVVKDSMEGFDSLIFDDGEKDSDKFTYKLSKDQLKKVDLAMNNFINNPGNYNNKGEMSDFDADETKVNITAALFGIEMVEEAIKHGVTIGKTKSVDEISKKKTSRKAKRVQGDEELSVDDQFEAMAKERNKKRQTSTSID